MTYTKDDGSATAVMDQIVKLFHPELSQVGVTVEILHGRGGLKHHGYHAAAICKINNSANRLAGTADARIVLDGDGWPAWDRKRRQAVIDHELEHLEVQRDDDGSVKTDDAGRPRLKLKLHDHQLGIFESVIRRNREHAVDAQVIAKAWSSCRQLEIDWETAEQMAHGSEAVPA